MACFPASSTDRTKPVYSLAWAQSVVSSALQGHARVSEMFLEETGLSPELLAKLLACKRPEWIVARNMLKYVDLCQEDPSDTGKIIRKYLSRFSYRFPEKFLAYLTAHQNELD